MPRKKADTKETKPKKTKATKKKAEKKETETKSKATNKTSTSKSSSTTPMTATPSSGSRALAAARQAASGNNSGLGSGIGTARLGSSRAPIGAATTNSRQPQPAAVDPQPASSAQVEAPKLNEPVRFTVKRDMETGGGGSNNVRKILIYITIVIVLGLGSLFLIENFINNDQNSQGNDQPVVDTNDDSDQQDQVQQIENTRISTTTKADTSASSISPNDSYVTDNSSIGSSANSTENVKISLLTHDVYQSFTRTSWELTGLTGGLPQVEVSYADREVTVTFSGITSEESLLQRIALDAGNVTSITGSEADTEIQFVLELRADSKYSVFIDGADTVVLDIKTDAQLAIPAEEPDEPEEPETPEEPEEPETPEEPEQPTDPGAPSDNNYDNEYSTNKQYITNDQASDNLISETYYYRDDGTSFLFSWAIRGVGNQFIPNATAELIEEDGTQYIEVVINNVVYDLLHSQGKDKATINISTGGTPLVDVFTAGFDLQSAQAVYRVELSRETQYKLYSTLDYQGYQLLTLEIKD